MGIKGIGVDAEVEQRGGAAQSFTRNAAEAEAPRVGHHSRIDAGRRLTVDNKLTAEGQVKVGYHLAYRRAPGLYP